MSSAGPHRHFTVLSDVSTWFVDLIALHAGSVDRQVFTVTSGRCKYYVRDGGRGRRNLLPAAGSSLAEKLQSASLFFVLFLL